MTGPRDSYVNGTSHETGKRGAASTDPWVSAATSHATNAAGNLDSVWEELTAEHGATSRDPRVNTGMGAAVNSVVT